MSANMATAEHGPGERGRSGPGKPPETSPRTGGVASPGDALQSWVRALERTAPIPDAPTRTLPRVIETMAQTRGDAAALISRDHTLSYRALAERANQWSRWALTHLVERGEANATVCLLMPNCPEYMAIWLGITRVGGVIALINTNLAGAALAHCINVASPRHVIADARLCAALDTARPSLSPGIACWAHGADRTGAAGRLARIDPEVDRLPGAALTAEEDTAPVTIDRRALLIYTSGTTGLPKAAHVSHARLMQWTHWFAGMMDITSDDRMYDCLPMFHSIGGVVATGAPLVAGGSVVVAERFSASRFWDDVTRFECTLFQYIGELCRYLVAAPPHAREAEHALRLACGNGLAANVWTEFQRRFAIPRVLEYYAATEASFSLYNCEGKPGAIGRIPPFLVHRFPVALLRFDDATGEPSRGADGLCVRCGIDEPGEAVGRISKGDGGAGASRFEGYTDAAASEKKIVRDVQAAGDVWYRTGDLMRRDARGFFYFVDRLGDTFRWKGENVSTTEVTAAIQSCPGVAEAVVYGVSVPGAEGRAGMAAIVAAGGKPADLDLVALRRHLTTALPAYARPLFVRILPAIETTTTFKPVKSALQRQGFDPATCTDPVYVDDPAAQAYVPLDPDLHARIASGDVRV